MQTININTIGILNKTNYNTVKYLNVYRYLCPYIIGHIIPITLKANNT